MKSKKPIVILPVPQIEPDKTSTTSTATYGNDYDHLFKIRVMGDSGVGKSSLILRAADGTFSENYISTIGVDFKILTRMMGDKKIKLQVWDTAGQERFRTIESQHSRGSHADIHVFDITDQLSFNNLSSSIEKGMGSAMGKFPIIIVANKYDLPDKRVVDDRDIADYVERLNAKYPNNEIILIGTSAKTGLNVETLITQTIQAAYRAGVGPTEDISSKESAKTTTTPPAVPSKMKHEKTINNDWNAASGDTALEKAIAVLSNFTGGGSKATRLLSGHPWRHGVYEVQDIIKSHIQTPIPSVQELAAKLSRIPNIPSDTYLSNFITYLKEEKYPGVHASPGLR